MRFWPETNSGDTLDFYHLFGGLLRVGSIIEPGNWGRIVKAAGWRHNASVREAALEQSRLSRFSHRPSRLEAAFVCLTLPEAIAFRASNSSFAFHKIYRVRLCDPSAASHITDARLCLPQGTFHADWADIYWMDHAAQASAIPGIDWAAATNGVEMREMLTLSQLRIEEALNS